MKKLTLSLIALLMLNVCYASPISIEKQGHFTVGGDTLQRDGTYDNSVFVGWAEQNETGQSYRGDHAFVDYQIPVKANKYPLVFIHGYGGSGVCWQMTPDDRDGFATLMLKRHYPTYVMDLPGRGRAGRTTAENKLKPVADEMFWFDIWRIGIWPNYNEGVQFSKDKEYLSQFFRQMTPNTGAYDEAVIARAMTAVFERAGDGVLVTHSQGGGPGWAAAMASPHVKGVIALEPGTFPFPKGEEPPAEETSSPFPAAGEDVSMEEFLRLTKIPILVVFGDNIPEERTEVWGLDNWRVRLHLARAWAETVNRRGGDVTVLSLLDKGLRGNTHFLMSDLNNRDVADILEAWMKEKGLV